MADLSTALPDFLGEAGQYGALAGMVVPRDRAFGDGWLDGFLAAVPAGVEVRIVVGSRMRTLDGVYDEFAKAWSFPTYFGHNKDAFDECMRELDDYAIAEVGLDEPPTGYLTLIVDAPDLLTPDFAERAQDFAERAQESAERAQDADLRWFAGSLKFYREHYRDHATPPASFAVVLAVGPDQIEEVADRWSRVGVAVTHLDDPS